MSEWKCNRGKEHCIYILKDKLSLTELRDMVIRWFLGGDKI